MSSMSSGLVSTSRSLQPLRSCGQSLNRSPRNAASSSRCCWIMVPMAPSRMTMRSANNCRRASARLFIGSLARCCIRTHTERMANGVRELGAVQGIEVKLVHVLFLQRMHLLDGHRGGNQLARLGIVFETVEAVVSPSADQ